MRQLIKKIIPRSWAIKLISFFYFNSLFSAKPKVFCVEKDGKRLFLSNLIDVTHWDKLDIGNNVFVWHFTILDTFNGVKIGNGCQIGARVGIFTHSSHNSIRIYNEKYHDIYFDSHKARIKGSVEIGANTFVGANSIIMPGTRIGKGCIVGAFSYVSGSFDDFSIISGQPAKKIGDTRSIDLRNLKNNPDLVEGYLKAFGFKSLDELNSEHATQ